MLKERGDFIAIVSARDDQGKPVALAMLEDHKKETVVAFLKWIPERLRATVEEVCADLYEGSINAVKEVLPYAKVVGDRFRVAKLCRAALDDLRKKDMEELKFSTNKVRRVEGRSVGLAKEAEDLEPEEQEALEFLFKCSRHLRKAYALREKLTQIFDQKLFQPEHPNTNHCKVYLEFARVSSYYNAMT